MDTNPVYMLMPVMMSVLFLLILNVMFGATFSLTPGVDLSAQELFASPLFIIFMAISLLSFVALGKMVLPVGNEMVSWTFTELPLALGFVVSVMLSSITPYFYFLPVWGLMMVYVFLKK